MDTDSPRIIDLSSAEGYALTEGDIIIQALQNEGLYKSNLRFRGFEGRQLRVMRHLGTDTPHRAYTYCCTEDDLKHGDRGVNAIEFAMDQDVPALAVYDGDRLDGIKSNEPHYFTEANRLEALVTVYFLKRN